MTTPTSGSPPTGAMDTDTDTERAEDAGPEDPPQHPVKTRNGYALLAAAEAAAVVFLIASVLLRHKTRAFVEHNHLDVATRHLFVTCLALATSGAALFTAHTLRRRPDDFPALAQNLRRLSPLVPLALVPSLLVPRLFDSQPIALLLLTAAIGLGTARAVAFALPDLPALSRAATRQSTRWDTTAWVLTGSLVWWLASRSIRLHHKGLTSNYDLGLFENLFWNTSHGVHGIALELPYFDQHAELILYPLALVYRLFPTTETLLIVQAIGLGGAMVPLYLLARRWLGPTPLAMVMPLVYAGFPAIHGAAFYDFHFLALSPVFVATAAYAFVGRHWRLFWPMVLGAMLCREDVALGLAVIAACLFLLGRARRVTATLAIVSLVYFVGVKMVWMRGSSFVEYYEELIAPGEQGFRGVLTTALTNPLFVLRRSLTEDKLLLALHLLVPTAFLAVRQWRTTFLLLPGTLIVGLAAAGSAVTMIHFHYSCHFTPYLFVAAIIALAVRRAPSRIALASGALVAATIVSVHFGALFRDPFRASFHEVSFVWTEADRAQYEHTLALAAQIPPDASVAASEYEGPLVARRRSLRALKEDVGTAEYIFYGVRGLQWGGGPQLIDALQSGRFGVVTFDDGYGLLRRGAPTGQNARVVASLKRRGIGSLPAAEPFTLRWPLPCGVLLLAASAFAALHAVRSHAGPSNAGPATQAFCGAFCGSLRLRAHAGPSNAGPAAQACLRRVLSSSGRTSSAPAAADSAPSRSFGRPQTHAAFSAEASAPDDDRGAAGGMGEVVDGCRRVGRGVSAVGAKGFSSRRGPVRDDACWTVREEHAGARSGGKDECRRQRGTRGEDGEGG